MNRAAAVAGFASFVLTVLSVPVIIRLSTRWQIFDPVGPLKIHSRPTSRLGGVAIAGSIVAAQFLGDPRGAVRAVPLFAALGILFAVGLADDLYGLSPFWRLAAQILAATIVSLSGWRLPIPSQQELNFMATVLFIVAFVNAMNFFDGSDGLAAGTAAIVALLYAFLAGVNTGAGSVLRDVAAWSTAGAAAGFLCFNWPVAKVFLGDSGSTVLGLALAFLGLGSRVLSSPNSARLFFLLFAMALPLLDLAFGVIRRARAGRSPFFGDRRHIYDLLLGRGWSPRGVALTCYAATVSLALVGWLSLRVGILDFVAVSMVALGVLAWVGSWLGTLRIRIGYQELHRGNFKGGRNPI